MKYFLRTFIGLGIVLLAMSVTALSCNKVGGNNSGGSGSGGDGGGGGNPLPAATGTITITPVAGKAKLTTKTDGNDTILINGGAVYDLTTLGLSSGNTGAGVTDRFLGSTYGDFFDLTITGGAAGNASGGLVLVSTGDLANITNFSTPAPGDKPTYGSGIVVESPDAAVAPDTPNDYNPDGFKFWGFFADQTAPTDNKPDTAPFSFTGNTGGGVARQPILTCVSAISTIVSVAPANAGRATPDKVLTGGQTARCFMLPRVQFVNAAAINSWFTAAAADPTKWKKAFYISVAGIRTDSKELKDVVKNFPGADDNAKVVAFMNGLSTAEMEQLARDNIYAYKKILVKLVTKMEFDAAK